jgi:hypothetical protein
LRDSLLSTHHCSPLPEITTASAPIDMEVDTVSSSVLHSVSEPESDSAMMVTAPGPDTESKRKSTAAVTVAMHTDDEVHLHSSDMDKVR